MGNTCSQSAFCCCCKERRVDVKTDGNQAQCCYCIDDQCLCKSNCCIVTVLMHKKSDTPRQQCKELDHSSMAIPSIDDICDARNNATNNMRNLQIPDNNDTINISNDNNLDEPTIKHARGRSRDRDIQGERSHNRRSRSHSAGGSKRRSRSRSINRSTNTKNTRTTQIIEKIYLDPSKIDLVRPNRQEMNTGNNSDDSPNDNLEIKIDDVNINKIDLRKPREPKIDNNQNKEGKDDSENSVVDRNVDKDDEDRRVTLAIKNNSGNSISVDIQPAK